MLQKDNEPLSILWRKRIGKILGILVLFVAGNYVLDWLRFGKSATLLEVFKTVYTGSSAGSSFWYGHLWYLYIYMAFLCSLPFLRALVQNLENKYFYYMIGIALVVKGLLPAGEYILSYGYVPLTGNAVPKWLVMDIVLYPCIGYFLQHRVTSRFRDLIWLWMANLISIAITGLLVYRKAIITLELNADVSQGFHSMFVVLNCITVFMTAKYCFTKFAISLKLKTAVHSMGQCTFGIYLFHIMILESDLSKKFLEFLLLHINSMAACFIQCGCVFLIG